jgi:hypothetical protein
LFTLAATRIAPVDSKRIGPNEPSSLERPKSDCRTLSKAAWARASTRNGAAATAEPVTWS